MEIQFKKCTENDIPQLIKVAEQSYQEHYTYLWQDEAKNYIANNFNEACFRQELILPNSEFYLALWQEKAVGFFKINDINKTHLELERIYLIAEAKGKGIGKAAIEFVEKTATSIGKSIIYLKTMQKGKAYLFYQKCGFQIVREVTLEEALVREDYKEMFVMEKIIQ